MTSINSVSLRVLQSKKVAAQWQRWCAHFDVVENGVFSLFHTRAMWRAVMQVVNSSGDPHRAPLHNYLVRTYVSSISSGIRREADPDTRSSSLARSLHRLAESPKMISRNAFIELWVGDDEGDSSAADMAFDQFALSGARFIEVERVEKDLLGLQRSAES